MKNALIFFAVFITATAFTFQHNNVKNQAPDKIVLTDTQYVCLPCGSECDNTIYTKPSTCPHCNMKLVDKASVKFNSIEPGALCSFIKDMGKQNVILLDVRTTEEFKGTAKDKFGRLAGAINIPVQQLEKRMGELNKYKSKEIIVYCSHSHRSPMASYMLMQKGFTRVNNMEFGMSEWKNKVKAGECSNKLYIKQ
ncbi:rhodanese-like domain-containing protein [Ferruginibacter sp. SUN106]|uniref:rhodanese-like domain-containing protein n=1 Tax=Ferruginibacter sp. SUN106 TaxID=2978348 RepID=UPI003D36C434